MIVWGSGNYTGGRYNPLTNNWTEITIENTPEARRDFSTVWTGTEMVVWGGRRTYNVSFTAYLNSIGIYNPARDVWRNPATQHTPDGRYNHSAVWTGTDLIIYGGLVEDDQATSSGGKLSIY
jgi:N-acetylneuraminic acid mutarotase